MHPDPGSWSTAWNPTRLKPKFLARGSVNRRTQDALYAEWQSLSFDSGNDDIEEFMTDIKNIARQLNYADAAQLMAIKGMLPIKVYNTYLNINVLNDLKDFLIKVFDNPRIKNRYAAGKDGEPSGSAFSMANNMETPSLGATAEMGKLISKTDSIEFSLHSLNNKGPSKHRVSPQQTRSFNCNPHQFQNDRSGQSSSQNHINYHLSRYQDNRSGQAKFINHGRGRFYAIPNVRCPQIAHRTPDKDKLHCNYSQEIGHFIKDFKMSILD